MIIKEAVMCDSSPVSDSRPDSSPFVPDSVSDSDSTVHDSVSDSDSKVHDSVSDSDSGPVTRWLGNESGTRPGNFGANAVSYPNGYLSFHSPKFYQNLTQYFQIYIESLTWISAKSDHGVVVHCLDCLPCFYFCNAQYMLRVIYSVCTHTQIGCPFSQ